jgi:hypothetical protein
VVAVKNWPWHAINGFIWTLIGVQAGLLFGLGQWPHVWWPRLVLALVSGFCASAFHDALSAEYLARKGRQ